MSVVPPPAAPIDGRSKNREPAKQKGRRPRAHRLGAPDRHARAVNDGMPRRVVNLVRCEIGDLCGKRVVTLGQTHKADVDDIRESPAIEVVRELRGEGALVLMHDAVLDGDKSVRELATGADALVLLVEHRAYTALDATELATVMRKRIIVDTRSVVNLADWKRQGFQVRTLGYGSPQVEVPI